MPLADWWGRGLRRGYAAARTGTPVTVVSSERRPGSIDWEEHMRKVLTALAVFASAAAVTVSPAGAVTGNFEKDFVHNYVGLVAFYDADGNFLWRCTGSLLNDRTVLTAGHCTDVKEGAVSAIFWASQEGGAQFNAVTGAEDPLTGYPNRCIDSADYPCAESHTLIEHGFVGGVFLHGNNSDVGMVILDTPIELDRYASVATAGSVDNLPTGTQVTVTGYGVSDEKPAVVSFRERLMAKSFIVSTHSANTAGFNIKLSTNPGNGRGGSCFGDSGGPILYDSTDVILGVNSFVVNGQCAGVGYAYRVDQANVIAWIQANAVGPVDFVAVP
jgi:V8-like Glu-specific endopeptidase